jgi:hypothetical protein
MERGALSTDEFKAFAKDYVLFCHITSKVEGEKYGDLLSKKGGTGFPYVVAMNAEGDIVANIKARTPEGFAGMMKDGQEFQTLMDKEERTPAEESELFLKRLGMSHFDLGEAKAEAARLTEVSEENQLKIDDAILGLEIQEHAPKGRSKEAASASGKIYADMYANGRMPTGGRPLEIFFICILQYAEDEGNATLFEAGLAKLKDAFGSNPRAAGFFAAQDKRLEALKASATEDE